MQVTKRNGEKEDFSVEKIHKVLEWATKDINNVSFSEVEMNANLSLYDGISSSEIHQILIKSANDLISTQSPNYQYVAARLLNMQLRKEVWGCGDVPTDFTLFLQRNVDNGVYHDYILNKWTDDTQPNDPYHKVRNLGVYINHSRDDLFTYAGLQQLIDKYLVKNRSTGVIYETPQYAYMCIAMCLFDSVESVKRAYDCYSTFKINLPTPIMAGVRTNIRQFASCVLVDVNDDIDGIFSSVHAVGKYTARRAGIGLNIGRIRPINSPIRGGEVIHTGVIPYLKNFECAVKSTSQNGLRGGSATAHIAFWHYEIEDVLVLKNNAGTDDNRVRKLDYSIQFCKLFYDRLIANQDITLFSPHEAKGLYEAFGDNKKFEELYLKYENSRSLKFKKKISARKLAEIFARERLETGRIYSMNIDNANEHGSWNIPCYMSNLCVTGDTSVMVDVEGQLCTISIEEVVQLVKHGKEVKILSSKDGIDSFELISDAAMMNESAEILEVTDLESGFVVKCTPDHKIYTKNRGYVMAKDLEETDELQIMVTTSNIEMRKTLKINKLNNVEKVFDVTVKHNHNFYANGILVSNCQEIIHPTVPIESINDPKGEIGICILSALNLLELNNEKDIELACRIAVQTLDSVIEYQEYPILAGETFAKNRRSLGIGITNLAGFLAKNKLSYNDEAALKLVHETMEQIQWHLINASCELAESLGPCPKFKDTKYSQGLLPIDWYKKTVDELVEPKYNMDWEGLRERVKKHGLRHSTLSAIMPCESSSVIQNSTNGIEPVRSLLIHKKAKNGVLKQLVPNYNSRKNYYTIAWDIKDNKSILNIAAVIQKFVDMSMSTNLYYNYSHYSDGNIPLSALIKDQIYGYKYGLKNFYYCNTPDGDKEQNEMLGEEEGGCLGGACSI